MPSCPAAKRYHHILPPAQRAYTTHTQRGEPVGNVEHAGGYGGDRRFYALYIYSRHAQDAVLHDNRDQRHSSRTCETSEYSIHLFGDVAKETVNSTFCIAILCIYWILAEPTLIFKLLV
jgi:hypothetical protein